MLASIVVNEFELKFLYEFKKLSRSQQHWEGHVYKRMSIINVSLVYSEALVTIWNL